MRPLELRANKYGVPVPTFSADGVKIINHYHGLTNVFCCNNTERFEETLRLLNRDDVPANFDLLLVRVFPDGHAQPIKIERRGGTNHIIVMDSLGERGVSLYNVGTLITVRNNLRGNIYYTPNRIQIDRFSCHALTAKFLNKMSKTPNLHEELKQSSSKEPDNIFRCKMPERFAVFAQSQEDIDEYLRTGGRGKGEIFINKDGVKETFMGKVHRPRVSGEVPIPHKVGGMDVPSLLDYFSRKYAEKITQIAQNLSDSALKELYNSQDSSRLTMEKLREIAGEWKEVRTASKSERICSIM